MEISFDGDYARANPSPQIKKPFPSTQLDDLFWPESCAALDKYSDSVFLDKYLEWKEVQ